MTHFSSGLGRILHRSSVSAASAEIEADIKAVRYKLERDLENTKRELAALYSYTQRDVDAYISKLIASVNSPDQYFRAGSLYTQEWFCSLPYSLDTKVKIATLLVQAVSAYNKSYVSDLWTALANRDYETLQNVRFYKVGGPGNDL